MSKNVSKHMSENKSVSEKVLALSGGVGGAKLVLGLSKVLSSEQMITIANTADDFEHLGLHISPDLDTVMYTLADLNNKELGWGLTGESWACMDAVERLQGETWFRLGDQDIATHLLRSEWKREGQSITTITQDLFQRLGIQHTVLPMCDEPVRTFVNAEEGELAFQDYFVRQQCHPEVSGFNFKGIEKTSLSVAVKQAVDDASVLMVCPSNPFVSIEPILAVQGMKQLLMDRISTRVVVSPIVGGMAIKGPAAKMMQELNMPSTALSVAEYYQGFATHFVLDSSDQQYQQAVADLGMQVIVTNTVMQTLDDRIQLANDILNEVGMQ